MLSASQSIKEQQAIEDCCPLTPELIVTFRVKTRGIITLFQKSLRLSDAAWLDKILESLKSYITKWKWK
jgi:hypothetical protein